jgi:hypothetical protein
MRAGSLSRARPGPTDGRSDAVAVRMTFGPHVEVLEQGMAESAMAPPFSFGPASADHGVGAAPPGRSAMWRQPYIWLHIVITP